MNIILCLLLISLVYCTCTLSSVTHNVFLHTTRTVVVFFTPSCTWKLMNSRNNYSKRNGNRPENTWDYILMGLWNVKSRFWMFLRLWTLTDQYVESLSGSEGIMWSALAADTSDPLTFQVIISEPCFGPWYRGSGKLPGCHVFQCRYWFTSEDDPFRFFFFFTFASSSGQSVHCLLHHWWGGFKNSKIFNALLGRNEHWSPLGPQPGLYII